MFTIMDGYIVEGENVRKEIDCTNDSGRVGEDMKGWRKSRVESEWVRQGMKLRRRD